MIKIKGILLLLLCASSVIHAQNRKKIDSLLAVVSNAAADTLKVMAMNDLSFEYQKVDPDSALTFAKKAGELSEKIDYPPGKATSLHNIGNVNYFKGDFSAALDFYNKALALREKAGNKKDIARSIGNIGNVHFAQGNYDKALVFYLRMFEVGKSISDRVTLADANGNIGNVYMMKGDYDKSLSYNLKSLAIREEMNDTRGMEHSYNNIGGIYFNQGNDTKALEYIQKSLALQQNIGNKKGMADSYQNIGSIYYHEGDMKKAFDYFNRCLEITKELGNKEGIAGAYDNFGSIYKESKQYDKAKEYHRKALDIYEETGDQKGMANALGNLGGDYTATGNFDEALGYITRALETGKRMGAKYYIKNAYDYFVQLYKKMNDPAKALMYYEMSSVIGDSMLNEENTRSIAEMQTKFDTEKKQKEIELLQKDKNLQELELAASAERSRSLGTLLLVLLGGLCLLFVFVLLVYRSNGQKKKNNQLLAMTNEELNRQKEITEQKNLLITDSVDYAETLINLRLPPESAFKRYFPEASIHYRPADIIGGCIYALVSNEKNVGIAMVDCRTTGVPGAFLALKSQQLCEQVLRSRLDEDIENIFQSLSKELEAVIPAKGVRFALLKYEKNGSLSTKAGTGMFITETAGLVKMSNTGPDQTIVPGKEDVISISLKR